ncbi:MAG: hypothetical protein KA712_19320 [Myxococcales bacterium]|nr:hypothetical protein [Myxococcales bacterium]
MNPQTPKRMVALCLLALTSAPLPVAAQPARGADPDLDYRRRVQQVANMTNDPEARALARQHELALLNVLWEDTGRWQGSSLGPNISDVTIEVEMKTPRGRSATALMPVLRPPNFRDTTGDVALDKIWLPVGNEKEGAPLAHITLAAFLADPTRYMSLPLEGRIQGGSLLAKRDTHALVSAQATFLPIPQDGQATFWPVIFNYQSSRRNPAVLTLLVTRQGTSMTVIDNARDSLRGQSWGQRLFFNKAGQRSPLTAERLSSVKATGVTANGESADSLGEDANLLMIIQVPLRFRQPPLRKLMAAPAASGALMEAPSSAAPAAEASRARRSDVETAVLGHGPELGPFTELDKLTISRDPRFPVRVTVQFYQATSNGVINADNVRTLSAQIEMVYASADYVGSLVVPRQADRRRPTNWDGVGPMPPGTRCEDFPGLRERGLCPPGHIGGPLPVMPRRRAGIQ